MVFPENIVSNSYIIYAYKSNSFFRVHRVLEAVTMDEYNTLSALFKLIMPVGFWSASYFLSCWTVASRISVPAEAFFRPRLERVEQAAMLLYMYRLNAEKIWIKAEFILEESQLIFPATSAD